MPTFVNTYLSALVRKGLLLLFGFIAKFGLPTAAAFLVSREAAIETGIVGFIGTLFVDGCVSLSKSGLLSKYKILTGLPPNASHDESLAAISKAVTVAEMAVGKPLAAIKNPASINPVAGLIVALLLPALALGQVGCTAIESAVKGGTAASELAKVSNTAQSVLNVGTLVPAAQKAKLAELVQSFVMLHPKNVGLLEVPAKALESIATVNGELPDPNGVVFTVISWGGNIPDIGSFVTDFVTFYKLAYPFLHNSVGALTELAELIRSFEPQKVAPAASPAPVQYVTIPRARL